MSEYNYFLFNGDNFHIKVTRDLNQARKFYYEKVHHQDNSTSSVSRGNPHSSGHVEVMSEEDFISEDLYKVEVDIYGHFRARRTFLVNADNIKDAKEFYWEGEIIDNNLLREDISDQEIISVIKVSENQNEI